MFDKTRYEAIPSDLDTMVPGPELAAVLAGITVSAVSGYDQVVVLRAHRRMASHYAAHTYADMAAISATLHAISGRQDSDTPMWRAAPRPRPVAPNGATIAQ